MFSLHLRRQMRAFSPWLVASMGLVLPSASFAHIQLVSPAPRYGKDLQKDGPCGDPNNGAGSGAITTFEPGQTIEVEFDEFINHEGHFRLSWSKDGDQDHADPTGYEDFYVNDAVLLDDIKDDTSGKRRVEIKLPDEPCERCSLQLIQMMVTSAAFDPSRALYYQCADIRLKAGGDDTTSSSSETTSESTSSSEESSSSSSTSDEQGSDTSTDATTETSSASTSTSNGSDSSTAEETSSSSVATSGDPSGDESSSQGESGDDSQSESTARKGCAVAGLREPTLFFLAGGLLAVGAMRRRRTR